MRIYFAPMEGLTDHIFRSLHHKYFPGIDRYYTPFLSPSAGKKGTVKDMREIPPTETLSFAVVPQILTKSSEDFTVMAHRCADLGYREVNVNLGCPSGTVTAKGKGSGMLRDPDVLDAFLYEIFLHSPVAVSVKTRIGFHDASEFPRILEIYNRYPIKELTIHPRVRDAFYKGSVDMEAFTYAAQNSRAPLCFNGNLCSTAQIRDFKDRYPAVEAVMLGRGLIGNPGMLTGTDITVLEAFYQELLDTYTRQFGSFRNAMFRMKENWRYLIRMFDGADRLFKQLRKTTDEIQYRELTDQIFHTCSLRTDLDPDW